MEIVLIIALLSALPIIYLILLQKKGKKSSTKSHPPLPAPPGIPIIGNMHQFDSSAPHIYLWELSRKYGPLMSLKHGCLPVLVVSSARMAEEVMKNHDLIFCSRPPMLGQRKLSYNGQDIGLAPYTNQWRELRKICVLHLLSSKRVQSFRPIREDEVYRMIQKISRESASSQVTDLTHTLLSLTCTMICRIGFGKRYDEEGQERKRFHFLIHEARQCHAYGNKLTLNLLFPYRRFLNSTIDATGKHFKFIPFGAGRRSCPGYYLGLATVELALANLLNSFNWGLPSGVKKEDIDTDVLPGLAMLKKNALRLVAKKRVPS
ncbi:unnamed protein product [Coffea canephora]|uniref:Cytochrome P450 n=1 Tax=Coffea canephora TaxID=49390 RepID=A0A068VGF4_COFCA|nr:unnamed protein product [Coffea canephora]